MIAPPPSIFRDVSDRIRAKEPVDLPLIEQAVRMILTAVGEDPDRDGLVETPRRVARSFAELFRGLGESLQERLTNQIADAIDQYLQPKGVAVVIEAEHFCMKMRGVNKSSSVMVTSTLRGAFRDDRAQGAEVLNLIHNSRR